MKNMAKTFLMLIASLVTTLACGIASASDHDDGEADLKGRDLNLTDLFVFREDKEIPGGSNQYLVFLINSNPRSLPRQQYFFSSTAYYDLHISRAGTSKNVAATTNDNVILRVQFAMPNSSNQQAMTLTTIVDGVSTIVTSPTGGGQMLTTPLTGAASPVNSTFAVNGNNLTLFAGLRKDPFFFDVTAFFKFRAAAAATSGNSNPAGFSSFPTYTPDGSSASDFTANYNVNTIALRVPIAFLQTALTETVFDTWATVSVPQQ